MHWVWLNIPPCLLSGIRLPAWWNVIGLRREHAVGWSDDPEDLEEAERATSWFAVAAHWKGHTCVTPEEGLPVLLVLTLWSLHDNSLRVAFSWKTLPLLVWGMKIDRRRPHFLSRCHARSLYVVANKKWRVNYELDLWWGLLKRPSVNSLNLLTVMDMADIWGLNRRGKGPYRNDTLG